MLIFTNISHWRKSAIHVDSITKRLFPINIHRQKIFLSIQCYYDILVMCGECAKPTADQSTKALLAVGAITWSPPNYMYRIVVANNNKNNIDSTSSNTVTTGKKPKQLQESVNGGSPWLVYFMGGKSPKNIYYVDESAGYSVCICISLSYFMHHLFIEPKRKFPMSRAADRKNNHYYGLRRPDEPYNANWNDDFVFSFASRIHWMRT